MEDRGGLGQETRSSLEERLRRLRSFGAYRRALRGADTSDLIAAATVRFATIELGITRCAIYVAEREDTDLMREENDRMLTGYSQSPDGKSVRIPVDRAMDLALQSGFKKSEAATSTKPTTRPTANNQR